MPIHFPRTQIFRQQLEAMLGTDFSQVPDPGTGWSYTSVLRACPCRRSGYELREPGFWEHPVLDRDYDEGGVLG